MTGASREAPKVRVLHRVPCICYSIQFRKDKDTDVLALLDSGSEVITMISAYTIYLGLKVKMPNVAA